MAYKKALIQRVLFYDLQPVNNNNNKPAAKSRNDKNGKVRNPERVATKR
jgi:hypothetical protein